ncbi:MAG: TIGR03067 domain-containing protein [Gemmataceae bacterium]
MTASLKPKLVAAAGVLIAVALAGATAQNGGNEPRRSPDPPADKAAAKDAVAAEMAKLQGRWRVVSIRANGREALAEELDGMTWTVAGDVITAQDKQGERSEKVRFTVDPTKAPKWFDGSKLTGPESERGKRTLGIYAVERDRWRLCFVEPDEMTAGLRPSEFANTKSGGVIELVRDTAPPPAITAGKLVGEWSRFEKHETENDTLVVYTFRDTGVCRLDALDAATGKPSERLKWLSGIGGWELKGDVLTVRMEEWNPDTNRPTLWVNIYTIEKLDGKELVVRNHKKTPAGEPFLPYKWTRFAGWDSLKK